MCGESVVVAHADFFVRDGVVLVDDRDEPLALQEEIEGGARITRAGTAIEVPVRQEHLRAEQPMAGEVSTVDRHQLGLADRGASLQLAGVLRALL